jgi:hypothetical protein
MAAREVFRRSETGRRSDVIPRGLARSDPIRNSPGRKSVLGTELTRLSAIVEDGRKRRRTVFQSRDTLR